MTIKLPLAAHISRKHRILDLLLESRGWCSGEEIAARLGISRAAVGKHIALLKEEGHAIEALPRRGYNLLATNPPITRQQVARWLDSRIIGQNEWRILQNTTSTNNEAILWASMGAPPGSIVISEQQSQGKGRKGHDWLPTPRSLMFSVILRPTRDLGNVFTEIALKAVLDATQRLSGMPTKAKAPNDVLLNNRKLAGILVESGWRGHEPDWTVIGIGCNVNALAGEIPESISSRATSLFMESGRPVCRSQLLALILSSLEKRYLACME